MTGYLDPCWGRSALLVIDLQRDFLGGGAAPVPGTDEIVPAVVRLAEAFRGAGRPVAHLVRLYEPGGSDVDPPRREAIEDGARLVAPHSEGSQIALGVTPAEDHLDPVTLRGGSPQRLGPDEVVFFKPRWSGFYRTALGEWLYERGCDTVVVTGCNLPNCPRATVFDASARDLRVVVVSDGVSQATPERLGDLELIGVVLHRASEVIEALAREDAHGPRRLRPRPAAPR